ncbi:DUF916 and DUF3324 domain-containing protein [Planococcus sp. 1R117A]|uniref:DUF916 and DUF3324 domain-containing protein n=1 Tax=Planococcus sp. 1R117A TaxID=3447020 RepID=UPI003EDC69C9
MKKLFCLMIAPLLFLALGSSPAAADDGQVGYSVEPHIPANQIDKKQTYFDLLMEPGQKQELTVTVWNSTNKDMKVKASINNPVTNRNGIIDYTKIDAETDESLAVPITNIAELQEELVTVPANGSETVTVLLKMPDEAFDGVILGGLYFEKVLDEETEDAGIQIQNKYTYVVGLMLSETDKVIKPELALKTVQPSLVNYRTAVTANIQNSTAAIVNDLEIDARVLSEDGEELVYVEKRDLSMAPNSNMDFVIDWENRELEPGAYTLVMDGTLGEENWIWEYPFEIPKEEAEELNEEAVDLVEGTNAYVNGGYSLVIVILLGIIFWLLRRSKKAVE